MEPLVIPALLRESATTEGRGEWLESLPRSLATAARVWALEVGAPFEPGGRTAWVAPVEGRDGRPLVLKLAWRHPESASEAAGLRAWDGAGAVRLVDELEVDDDTTALLLERCVPGSPLDALPEPDQDRIIARLLLRLWIEPPPGRFRPLSEMVDLWAAGFEASASAVRQVLDPGLVREGLDLWRNLPTTAATERMLVTDLHAGNVLSARREPWLVIDPKPFVGDPHYDATQHLLNCPQRLVGDPLALIGRLADLTRLDADRLRRWTFARCVVESPHWPGLAELAQRLAPS